MEYMPMKEIVSTSSFSKRVAMRSKKPVERRSVDPIDGENRW